MKVVLFANNGKNVSYPLVESDPLSIVKLYLRNSFISRGLISEVVDSIDSNNLNYEQSKSSLKLLLYTLGVKMYIINIEDSVGIELLGDNNLVLVPEGDEYKLIIISDNEQVLYSSEVDLKDTLDKITTDNNILPSEEFMTDYLLEKISSVVNTIEDYGDVMLLDGEFMQSIYSVANAVVIKSRVDGV